MLLPMMITFGVASLSAQDATRWARADSSVVRLAPTSFPQLPADIQADLLARGCRIPQTYLSDRPHNVVVGRLTHLESRDWAVLCSVGGISRVLVYRAEAPTSPDSLAPEPDRKYLQGWGGDRVVYSREIALLHADDIRQLYGDSLPMPAVRDGINDAFAGKTSKLHYWHDGAWRLIESEY